MAAVTQFNSGAVAPVCSASRRESRVPFRLKAFGLHLLVSTVLLTAVLGGMYLGWYRWPGWYLAGMRQVAAVLVGVDVALGPLLTLVIASPKKPRRELARDITVIAAVQIAALVYGSITLWSGRPLYYAFSSDRLEMVQAYDLSPTEIALGRRQNPALAPSWLSTPRWVWAPLPENAEVRKKIMSSAIFGGTDVTEMPRYFKPWNQAIPELKRSLKKVDALGIFSKNDKSRLKERMRQLGLATDEPTTIFLTGRVGTVLAVFDRSTMRLEAIVGPQ
ncbi:MAG TPA: hypothetical protein VMU40_07990 [Steroidobacteraceae bacterium]|nr:hypothetical protein [Steroidobacteraceae bacterium]